MDRVSEENVARLEGLLEKAVARAEAAEAMVASLQKSVIQLAAMVEDLESRLNRNSRNSNSPPSTDTPDKKPPAAGPAGKRPKGGQKGHPGHRRAALPPTRELKIPPACSCGSTGFENLRRGPTHQVVEIPSPSLEVTHLHLLKGRCARCGKTRTAAPPKGMETGYGPNLTALVGELSGPMRLSRSRTRSLLKSIFGLDVSTGAVQAMVDRVSDALLPVWERLGEMARSRPVNHVDETSWRTGPKRSWIWCLVNKGACFFAVHSSRSMAAFKELVGDWAGFLVSDDYGTYIKWEHGRQTCMAHLIRAARGFAEHKNPDVSASGTELLAVLEEIHRWAKEPPDDGAMVAVLERLHGWCERHRSSEEKLGALARRLADSVPHLAAFLYQDGVEPTNNRAERALRFGVLWRKMTFGSDSEKGCRWTERVLTLVASCAEYGAPTYPVILDAVKSRAAGNTPSLEWAAA